MHKTKVNQKETKDKARLHIVRRDSSCGEKTKTKGETYIEGNAYGQSQQAVEHGEVDPENGGSSRHCYGKCTAAC